MFAAFVLVHVAVGACSDFLDRIFVNIEMHHTHTDRQLVWRVRLLVVQFKPNLQAFDERFRAFIFVDRGEDDKLVATKTRDDI